MEEKAAGGSWDGKEGGLRSTGVFAIKSKIWIENGEGRVVVGSGRLQMLDAIERLGSIHAAALELHMSYRAVWGKVRATEKRLGMALLQPKGGGAQRSGSELTVFGKELVERFRKLEALTKESADHLFLDFFQEGKGEAGEKP